MYARDVEDQRVTLFVSGKLWARSLVMQDTQTQSLWSHILGEAMDGPLKGKTLDSLPSVMTDWGTWRQAHPDTSLVMLPRTSMVFTRNMYHRLKEFGLGLVLKGNARFWRFDLLDQQPVVNDELGEEELLVLYDSLSKSAQAFRRRVGDRTLTFVRSGEHLTDRETQSRWDWHLGKATEGPLAGKQLDPLPAILSFSHTWLFFHPTSTRWTPQEG